MSGHAGGALGGVIVIGAVLFGAGYAAAPDSVERVETKVEIVKVPVPTVITKTKTVKQPAPKLAPSCTSLPDKVAELAAVNEQLLASIASVPNDISDARQGIERGVIAETTDPLERIDQAKAQFAILYQDYMQAESRLEVLQQECRKDSK